jgi:hypothetical protein
VIKGANRNDIKLLEDTLQSIVTALPEGVNLCLAAGYAGFRPMVKGRRTFIDLGKEERRGSLMQRRVAYRLWKNRFSKPLVRY